MLEDDLLVCAADKLASILLVETGLTTGTDGLEKLDTLVIFTLSASLLVGLGKELAKLPCHCLNCLNFVHNCPKILRKNRKYYCFTSDHQLNPRQ